MKAMGHTIIYIMTKVLKLKLTIFLDTHKTKPKYYKNFIT